ncbi:MAG: right-handed parallel beta-helix repeat-containing protein, partial [Planctomycetota bacterium]
GYSFPISPEQSHRAISGTLQIDVRRPQDSGYLMYQLSGDGINWTNARELAPGSHDISIESVRGTCYVVFSGAEVLIDNLWVNLSASPATIHVPGDFSTIQAAIDSSADGDIIEVASGTYRGDGNRGIDFGGRAITLRGSAGPGQTTIDCAGNRGFYFHSSEGSNSVVRGFTITGGLAGGSDIPPDNDRWSLSSAHPVGGGIFCEFSGPSIIDCVIRKCSAELGGGIGIVGGAPTIVDCVIEQCRAGGFGAADSRGYGAGIGLTRDADATIIDCTIKNNTAYHDSLGAGICCWQSTAVLTNCEISRNSAQGNVNGGGLYCGGSSAGAVLENCVISNNTAEAGGGVYTDPLNYVRLSNCTIVQNKLSGPASSGGGVHSLGGDVVIRNSIVWFNDGTPVVLSGLGSSNPVLFSNIEGYYPGQGNIDADPLFASTAAGDYHLQSALPHGRYDPSRNGWVADGKYSPCIDAGDPQDPVGSEPFPNSERINMGAYGGTVEASKSMGPLIFHVDGANGSNYNSGLSKSDAFATIQEAVVNALDGDTVVVWPGTYREEVIVRGKAITLQSADEAAIVTAPSGYAFSFYWAESSRSVLRNFVITGCGQGAVYCSAGSPTLTNLTIVDNTFGIEAYDGADPRITSCIFFDNDNGDLFQFQRSAYFSNLQQLLPLDAERGNISEDPKFVDPANGDYHLQSRYGRYDPFRNDWVTDALNSPCIDAGDPSVYPGRERMPHGGNVNMGAYGGTPSASLSGLPTWSDANLAVQPNLTN